ncbi:MAG: hypothetical protein WBN49_09035, partial [Arenicellales bacterium]
MRNVLKWLSILLPITILSACDNSEISETNTPEKMPAPVAEQKIEKQQAAAPIEPKVSEPELSGEALYTSDKAPDSML